MMNIKKIIKDKIKECLREENMYLISENDLMELITAQNSLEATVDKLEMTYNMLEDRLVDDKRPISKYDLDLMRIDLQHMRYCQTCMKEVTPTRYY